MKKVKLQIYVTVSVREKLDRLYAQALLSGKKQSYSSIVTTLIEQVPEKDKNE